MMRPLRTISVPAMPLPFPEQRHKFVYFYCQIATFPSECATNIYKSKHGFILILSLIIVLEGCIISVQVKGSR